MKTLKHFMIILFFITLSVLLIRGLPLVALYLNGVPKSHLLPTTYDIKTQTCLIIGGSLFLTSIFEILEME